MTSMSGPAGSAGSARFTRRVPQQPVHQKNSYASETPVTDGERVYVYLGYVGLFAFDMSGNAGLVEADGRAKDAHRMGHRVVSRSPQRPALHRERQRRALVHRRVRRAHGRSSCGAPLARTRARTGRRHSCGRTSSAPRSSRPAPGSVRSYDTNGKLLWELAGMTSIHAVTPVAGHGLLFVSSGYFPDNPRPTYAIRPGAAGDISLKASETSNEFIAWSQSRRWRRPIPRRSSSAISTTR